MASSSTLGNRRVSRGCPVARGSGSDTTTSPGYGTGTKGVSLLSAETRTAPPGYGGVPELGDHYNDIYRHYGLQINAEGTSEACQRSSPSTRTTARRTTLRTLFTGPRAVRVYDSFASSTTPLQDAVNLLDLALDNDPNGLGFETDMITVCSSEHERWMQWTLLRAPKDAPPTLSGAR